MTSSATAAFALVSLIALALGSTASAQDASFENESHSLDLVSEASGTRMYFNAHGARSTAFGITLPAAIRDHIPYRATPWTGCSYEASRIRVHTSIVWNVKTSRGCDVGDGDYAGTYWLAGRNLLEMIEEDNGGATVFTSDAGTVYVKRGRAGVLIYLSPDGVSAEDCEVNFCPALVVSPAQIASGSSVRDIHNQCTFQVEEVAGAAGKNLLINVNEHCARDYGVNYSGRYELDLVEDYDWN